MSGLVRKYPIGNDDFVSLRKAGEVYVDKTELMWQMIQLSIFSTLNNLSSISMMPEFAALTGFTDVELDTVFRPDVAMLGERLGQSPETTRALLKSQYDGNHFSESEVGVYNPFSLMKAFNRKKPGNYWFESGTPTFIFDVLHRLKTDITSLEQLVCTSEPFDLPTEAMTDALPLLYQSGDYGMRCPTDGRRVVKVGIRFDMRKLGIRDWKVK